MWVAIQIQRLYDATSRPLSCIWNNEFIRSISPGVIVILLSLGLLPVLELLYRYIPYNETHLNVALIEDWIGHRGSLSRLIRTLSVIFGILAGLWWWCSSSEGFGASAPDLNKGAAASATISLLLSIAGGDTSSRISQGAFVAAVVLALILGTDLYGSYRCTRALTVIVISLGFFMPILLGLNFSMM